jgi:hypothetical protein
MYRSLSQPTGYCMAGAYENDGALLEIDRHLTVLPKVLKARPLQMHPPNTELPDSEGSENDEAEEDDWHNVGGEVSANDPAREDARSGRGKKRERPRGVAGPRGAETVSWAAHDTVAEQDTHGRKRRDNKHQRRDTGDASIGEGAAAATSEKPGFRPKK